MTIDPQSSILEFINNFIGGISSTFESIMDSIREAWEEIRRMINSVVYSSGNRKRRFHLTRLCVRRVVVKNATGLVRIRSPTLFNHIERMCI